MSLHRESRQVGICRECNRRVQPTPVMSVTISKYKTGLGSLVGANRTVAQLYKQIEERSGIAYKNRSDVYDGLRLRCCSQLTIFLRGKGRSHQCLRREATALALRGKGN